MQKTMFAALSVLVGVMIPTIAQANTAGSLRIVVDGIRQQQGQVCVSLFAGSQGFPDRGDRAVRAQCVPAGKRTALTFRNVAFGNYAIAVYHDRNGNGKLDRNFLGIPTEGFGFSRNPVIRTGAPRFGEAAVFVAGTETIAQIQLQYF
ncbi:DUF2141 domain-containing protein [Leptolyngbya sp. NIES-2104]|uniref:DUF2141 domain-containing protein n=1 Tax=Leptolyngbya sp. NIES-2104 TaxID=1552121 RepID=UPI001CEDA38F|nr:DUF2141 domain-containing protein [Leptolyngbya sp. NIES-2104]